MKFEHPEYIQAYRQSKRSNKKAWGLAVVIMMIMTCLVIPSMVARAEINIIYPPETSFNQLQKEIKVEVGISPEEAIKKANEQTKVTEILLNNAEREFKYSESIPLSPAVQEYIWVKCKEATNEYVNYYYFMLGAIEHESSFRSKAVHYNSNGSVDRGLCQINSSNVKRMKSLGIINTTDDLFDTYKNLDCAFVLMNRYIDMFGITESAYYAYNTGREKTGSNKNSRAVMKNMEQWKALLTNGN